MTNSIWPQRNHCAAALGVVLLMIFVGLAFGIAKVVGKPRIRIGTEQASGSYQPPIVGTKGTKGTSQPAIEDTTSPHDAFLKW